MSDDQKKPDRQKIDGLIAAIVEAALQAKAEAGQFNNLPPGARVGVLTTGVEPGSAAEAAIQNSLHRHVNKKNLEVH